MKKLILLLCFIFSPRCVEAANALSVHELIKSIAVNIHIGASGAYSNNTQTISELQYLGIGFVRNNLRNWTDNRTVAQGASVLINQIVSPCGDPYSTKLQEIIDNKDILFAVEGPNEIDNFSCADIDTPAKAAAFQQTLFNDTRNYIGQVDSLTDTTTSDIKLFPPLAADYVSIHTYTQFGTSSTVFPNSYFQVRTFTPLTPGKFSETTEIGWWTAPCATGVTQDVQAKYALNAIFDGIILNMNRTYFYELNDEFADPTCTTIEKHFGLFTYDDVAKEAATSIHNLTTLLADSGVSTGGNYVYTLTNMPAGGKQVLLSKSNGEFWLELHNDQQIWNNSTHVEIPVSPVAVTVGFAGTVDWAVYDPFLGTSVVDSGTGTSAVVNVPDHSVLVKIVLH